MALFLNKDKIPLIEKERPQGPSAPPSSTAALGSWKSLAPLAAPKPRGATPWEWYEGAFRWPEKQYLSGPDNFEIWLQRVTLQMFAFGWKKGDDISAKDDARLAMHLSQIMEPQPWLHVNHLIKGTDMIEQLKVTYRGETSFAKAQAIRALGMIKMRKSESVVEFQARFDTLVMRVKAAGGHKADSELIDLYLCGVSDRFPWWVTAMRTMDRSCRFTLRDIQISLFQEDRQRGDKGEFTSKRANNSDSIIPETAKSRKNKKKDAVCWDCRKKGHYRGSEKCKGPKERSESKDRGRPKGRDSSRARNRSRDRDRNRSKEGGRSEGRDRSKARNRSRDHGGMAERQGAIPAHLTEYLDDHACAMSPRVGQEAMEDYKNLCARLEAERPNGDYPREGDLSGSRV